MVVIVCFARRLVVVDVCMEMVAIVRNCLARASFLVSGPS